MAKNSKIEWTHHTFNPWLGCSKVSAACRSCYAEAWAKRSGLVKWGDAADRRRTSASYWKQPLKWNREAEGAGERRRVFCASLADVFEDRPEMVEWRDELFELIHRTPSLLWLLLTKRPENIARLWPFGWVPPGADNWPNVWLGTTVENQETALQRIPHLMEIPASALFLSCEPLLGPINLHAVTMRAGDGFASDLTHIGFGTGIDWVIIGGESGNGARLMESDWLINLRDQCVAAKVPTFIKQMGVELAKKFGCRDAHGGNPEEWPAEYRIRQIPEVINA